MPRIELTAAAPASLSRRAGLALMLLGALVSTATARSLAADRAPVVVFSAASVDRFLAEVDYVFQSADQQEPVDKIHGFLLNLNNLKGIDRGRPIGAMLYVPTNGGKDPDVIGFIPISSISDLQSTLRISNQVSLETGSAADRWELRGGENTLHLRLVGDYGFVAKQADLLDGTLPDVAALTSDLAKRYDASIEVSRQGVPPEVLEQVLSRAQADLGRDAERKPGENEAQFKLRTRLAEMAQSVAKQVLADAGGLTVGLNVSQEDREAEVEAVFHTTPRSDLSQLLAGLATSKSQFAVNADAAPPLAITTSWSLSPDARAIAADLIDQARTQIGQALKVDLKDPASEQLPVRKLVDAIDGTVQNGRIDGMVQFVGEPPGKMVMVAALGMAHADDVAAALEQLLPLVGLSPEVRKLEMNFAKAGGVSFHRITGQKVRMQDEQLYGSDLALYVGAGRDALWVALGGAQAPEVLEEAMTAEGHGAGDDARRVPLLHAAVHLTNWIGVVGDGSGAEAQRFIDAARKAFSDPEQDALAVELGPTDEGLRLHVQVDEGYIRLLGLALAARMRQ